jgi:hypothetical protein
MYDVKIIIHVLIAYNMEARFIILVGIELMDRQIPGIGRVSDAP